MKEQKDMEKGKEIGMEIGMEKGMEKGTKRTIISFLQDGIISREIAMQRLEINEDQLNELIKLYEGEKLV
jgi:flagellar biosynthesis/type III secretory pathway protein FliH